MGQKQGENIACPMCEQVANENAVLKAGGDLDAHGCKHSAGEEYCSATQKCIRPWEEKCEELGCSECQARQKQGENIACPMCEQVANENAVLKAGGDLDAHGCKHS